MVFHIIETGNPCVTLGKVSSAFQKRKLPARTLVRDEEQPARYHAGTVA